MKSFKEFKSRTINEGVATTIAKKVPWGKVATKIGGAFAAAKGGEKILKDLLGTPSRPKDTDWVNNPKDEVDDELNVRQNQAKDADENKEFDKDIGAYRKTIDPKTGKSKLSSEDQLTRLKDAAKKHIKNKKKDVKEDTTSKPVYGDGHDYSKGLAVTGRLDFGKGKKSEYDVGLSYKGSVLARKTRKFDKPEKTSPKDAVDAALNKFNRKTPDKGGDRTT